MCLRKIGPVGGQKCFFCFFLQDKNQTFINCLSKTWNKNFMILGQYG